MNILNILPYNWYILDNNFVCICKSKKDKIQKIGSVLFFQDKIINHLNNVIKQKIEIWINIKIENDFFEVHINNINDSDNINYKIFILLRKIKKQEYNSIFDSENKLKIKSEHKFEIENYTDTISETDNSDFFDNANIQPISSDSSSGSELESIRELGLNTELKLNYESLFEIISKMTFNLDNILKMIFSIEKKITNSSEIKYLGTIKNSSFQLLTITNDILDFLNLEVGKIKLKLLEFDLYDCINSAINIMSEEASKKNIKIICDISTNVNNKIIGDRKRLKQILINLISNGIKFTKKGHIKITVINSDINKIRFTISDTGIGIENHNKINIFKPFYKENKNKHGNGLGLFISKKIVELMNGKIWFESEIKQGSKFIFEIDAPESSIIRQLDTKNYNIFIIESDKKVRLQLLTIFGSFGINPIIITSSEEILFYTENGSKIGIFFINCSGSKKVFESNAVMSKNIKGMNSSNIIVISNKNNTISKGNTGNLSDIYNYYISDPINERKVYDLVKLIVEKSNKK